MNEVSPCKKCEHVNEDKNKNPACIRCIDEGMPLRYAKGVENGYTNDPEVFKMHSPDEYIKRICHHNGISVEILMDPKSKRKGDVSKIRKKIALGLREKFKINDSQIARALNVTQSSIWHMFKYDKYKGKIKERAVEKKKDKKIEESQYFKDITIADIMNRKPELTNRFLEAAEKDMRSPEEQLLYYIVKGVEQTLWMFRPYGLCSMHLNGKGEP